MSWSDNKELSSGADDIGWNSLKKKKKGKRHIFIYLLIYFMWELEMIYQV